MKDDDGRKESDSLTDQYVVGAGLRQKILFLLTLERLNFGTP